MRSIAKACRTRPIDKNTIRGACASAHSWYKDKGKSDDCFRFLLNVGVLLEEDRAYYFDDERADVVQQSIEQGRQPTAAAAATIRLAFVKAAIVKARTSSPCAIVPNPTPSSSETTPDSEPPKTDRSSVAVPIVEATTPEPVAPTAEPPRPLFRALPMPPGFIIDAQFVIYLTPVEKDVWESAIIQARQIADSTRVGVPNNPEHLQTAWGDKRLEATPEDYLKALQRFVDSDLIRAVGPSGNNHVAYEFVREPERYHVVPISSRTTYEMAPMYLDIIRAIQNGIYTIPSERGLQNHFTEWVSVRWPAVNPKTVYNKMVNFTPDNEYVGYGILYRHDNRYLLSVKGLERFDFIPNQQPIIRRTRASHEVSPGKHEPTTLEIPISPPMRKSPVANGNAPNEGDLVTQIRELEESIERQRSQLVALKLALKREQDAEREALKREIAEATRLRNEADKREADARAKLRKLGVEFPK